MKQSFLLCAAAIVALSGLATAPAGATVLPASSSGCSGGDPEVCIAVTGSGLHVNSVTVSGWFPSGGDYYLEMWSSSWYYSGANLSYGPGTRASLTENPNDNLPNGSGVCGTVTRFGGQRVAEKCLTIHS